MCVPAWSPSVGHFSQITMNAEEEGTWSRSNCCHGETFREGGARVVALDEVKGAPKRPECFGDPN